MMMIMMTVVEQTVEVKVRKCEESRRKMKVCLIFCLERDESGETQWYKSLSICIFMFR
jgi:ribosomal protein S1